MILLLDAHVVLWWLAGGVELDRAAAASIANPMNDVLVSAATIWELEVKRVAGRLRAPEELLEALDTADFGTVPVSATDAIAAARLPSTHADPFDRMLVAQAQRLGALIVSRDRALAAHEGVEVLPA